MTPTEIGLIAASYPPGQRAEAIIDLVAAKGYGGIFSQSCADAAMLVMVAKLRGEDQS